jgi:hypothetical protein
MEEEEWESELEETIRTFYESGGFDATAIIVDGVAVRKKDGLVFISGGYNCINSSTSTEIYDYANKSVRKGPEMNVARYGHASVALPTGDVAVFGGYNKSMRELSSCEVFNVESNSFSEIGNMIEKRYRSAAVLLPTGVVLIIGGHDASEPLISCEFFNPLSNTFTPSKAKSMVGIRGHTASLLRDGRVLVCGGYGNSYLRTTEIYDPSTDSFSDGPLMTMKRSGHTATTLLDGRVLVTGGEHNDSSKSTEFYDPVTETFTAGPRMGVTRQCHFSALLPYGRVLIGGGNTIESKETTEIFSPNVGLFARRVNLLEERWGASASNF